MVSAAFGHATRWLFAFLVLIGSSIATAATTGDLPVKTEWSYTASTYNSSHGGNTEAAAIAAMIADPMGWLYGCTGGGTMIPLAPWSDTGSTTLWSGAYPIHQSRPYSYLIPTSQYTIPKCGYVTDNGAGVLRTRSVGCAVWFEDPVTHLCLKPSSLSLIPEKNFDVCSVGTQNTNPINCATGRKLQTETDFVSPTSPWLRLDRYYASGSGFPGSLLSDHWRHSFNRRLDIVTRVVDGIPNELGLRVQRPNGNQYQFILNASGGYDHDDDVNLSLTRITDGSGQVTGWRLTTDSNDSVEVYDAQGLLTSIEDRTGVAVTLTYTGELLTRVTDRQGRFLQFAYSVLGTATAAQRLTEVTLPDGQVITYGYNSDFHLSRVTYPDSTPTVSTDNPHRDYVYGEGTWRFRFMRGQHSGACEATVPDHVKPRFRAM